LVCLVATASSIVLQLFARTQWELLLKVRYRAVPSDSSHPLGVRHSGTARLRLNRNPGGHLVVVCGDGWLVVLSPGGYVSFRRLRPYMLTIALRYRREK
jgi:hypothetical protein